VLQRDPLALTDERLRAWIEVNIGWSKMCVMLPALPVVILNEDIGIWHEGAWFSNLDFRQRIDTLDEQDTLGTWEREYWR
jgi:hypothetical protein